MLKVIRIHPFFHLCGNTNPIFLDFDGICNFDLLNLFLLHLSFAFKSPSSYIAFECLFCASSFSVCRYAINLLCSSSIFFYCFKISMSSSNCALVNSMFPFILREVMASATGEECVTVVEAFLFRVLNITKIHELWILSS